MLDLPQKMGNSNTENSAPILGLRIHRKRINSVSEGKIGHLTSHIIRKIRENMPMSLTYNSFLSKVPQGPGKTGAPEHFPGQTDHRPHMGSIFSSPEESE